MTMKLKFLIIDSIIMVTLITANLDCDEGNAAEQDIGLSHYGRAGDDVKIISRIGWKARAVKRIKKLNVPVQYVIIHDTITPPACRDRKECDYAMRAMQTQHIDDNGWPDVGYHFAVGGDGVAYEGRGWDKVGSHALKFNNISIGICFIGNWNDARPPRRQIVAVQNLIKKGVADGYISEDYKLIGHRQTRPNDCPGNELFLDIQKWPHYDSTDFTNKRF